MAVFFRVEFGCMGSFGGVFHFLERLSRSVP